MVLEICTVGGFDEVGKNMTAIRVDDEVVICDMGLHLDPYIRHTQTNQKPGDKKPDISTSKLTQIGALPDINQIAAWKRKVIAILPTHGHLDHVGAIPWLAKQFTAPIICTPYTAEVIKAICTDEKINLKNEIRTLQTNSKIKLSEKITIEFLNMTHSTPQAVMICIHTPYGQVLYGNDFKLDDHPTLGKKPNYGRLKELNDVVCFICDSIYSGKAQKTPSERIAREMLKEVMLETDSEGKAVIISTFSSHLARLQSILEFGKKMNRKIVFLGRSLAKYVQAGENINIINFKDHIDLKKYRKKIDIKLKQLSKNPSKYLIVCTGHQGEEGSVLSRIADGTTGFKLHSGDHVIFSCTTIPSELNIASREVLESKLKKQHVRIFKDIHVSGHAAKEDLRRIIQLIKPEHIIPAHGNAKMANAMVELCVEEGFKLDEDVHIMHDGDFIEFD